eukprot:1003724-Pelagomonas_calceolata.AAC.2
MESVPWYGRKLFIETQELSGFGKIGLHVRTCQQGQKLVSDNGERSPGLSLRTNLGPVAFSARLQVTGKKKASSQNG